MTLATAMSCAGMFVNLIALVIQLTGIKEIHVAWGIFALGEWTGFASNVLSESPTFVVIDGLLAALFTYLWWKNRPKGRGRKALRELGAKSRAVVESMVEQMTPSPIPSPVGAS